MGYPRQLPARYRCDKSNRRARRGQAAGVPRLHPHLLRHTAATQYLVNGGDAISLQHRLGHSGLEMTNRYVHFASAPLRRSRKGWRLWTSWRSSPCACRGGARYW
ncbi:MAG: tyrosine-type recombinase/integrase [Chloroflexota bacterium]|nr:tyrosine-type recombinase/integrase [Chloroflexota bacterium]